MKPFFTAVLRALPWLAVGLAACGVTLLILAPAGWVTPYLAQASGHRVELIDPSGSLWHGEATLMLSAGPDIGTRGADTPAPTLLPGRIVWHTAFWPLWQGRLHTEITQTAAMQDPVELDLDRHQATLTGGSLNVPATLLAGLGSPFNTLDLKGDMRLDWTPCRVFGGQAYGQLNLTLTDLGSRVSRVSPLGSYRLNLALGGRDASLTLATLRGPLLLEGHGRASTGSFNFNGTARAAPGFSDGLAGLLNILGSPRGDGIYSLRTMP